MRAAGIDFGKVRIGVAVADELGKFAHPRPHLDGRDRRRVMTALTELAEAESITLFIVGLPRLLNGDEGPAARRARRFADELHARTGVAVELLDEWLTTREAQVRMRDTNTRERDARARIDSAAAAVLLQGYLDAAGHDGEP